MQGRLQFDGDGDPAQWPAGDGDPARRGLGAMATHGVLGMTGPSHAKLHVTVDLVPARRVDLVRDPPAAPAPIRRPV
jgi:hypothetical protein